jgi:hypothetical protein
MSGHYGAIFKPQGTPKVAAGAGIQVTKLVQKVHAAEPSSGRVEPPKTIAKSAATLLVLPR